MPADITTPSDKDVAARLPSCVRQSFHPSFHLSLLQLSNRASRTNPNSGTGPSSSAASLSTQRGIPASLAATLILVAVLAAAASAAVAIWLQRRQRRGRHGPLRRARQRGSAAELGGAGGNTELAPLRATGATLPIHRGRPHRLGTLLQSQLGTRPALRVQSLEALPDILSHQLTEPLGDGAGGAGMHPLLPAASGAPNSRRDVNGPTSRQWRLPTASLRMEPGELQVSGSAGNGLCLRGSARQQC